MDPPPAKSTQQDFLTPPQRSYQPGAHNFSPYGGHHSSPTRHGEVFTSPGFSEASSMPQTPIKGFTKEQVKLMAKVWNSPAKLMEIVLTVVAIYTNNEADVSKITEIMTRVLEMNVIFLVCLRGLIIVVKPSKNLLCAYVIRSGKDGAKGLGRQNPCKYRSSSESFPQRIHSRPKSPPLHVES